MPCSASHGWAHTPGRLCPRGREAPAPRTAVLGGPSRRIQAKPTCPVFVFGRRSTEAPSGETGASHRLPGGSLSPTQSLRAGASLTVFLNCKIRNSKRTIPAIFNCSSEALSGSQCGAATAPATSGAPALGHCPRQRKCSPFPAPPSPLRVRERESSRDSACPWRWAHFTEQCPHGAPALQAVSGAPSCQDRGRSPTAWLDHVLLVHSPIGGHRGCAPFCSR